jgi:hypothetical protein
VGGAISRAAHAIPIVRSERKEFVMADKKKQELTAEELEQQDAEEMPDREEMSLVNLNAAAPINAAVGLNALSDGSTANADASQFTPIDQSTT